MFIVHDILTNTSFLSLKVWENRLFPAFDLHVKGTKNGKAQNYCAISFLIGWCCSLVPPLSAAELGVSGPSLRLKYCEFSSANVC